MYVQPESLLCFVSIEATDGLPSVVMRFLNPESGSFLVISIISRLTFTVVIMLQCVLIRHDAYANDDRVGYPFCGSRERQCPGLGAGAGMPVLSRRRVQRRRHHRWALGRK